MKLYSYWRSSSSYRVRIALNLKGLAYQTQAVNLLENEQQSPAYATLNPARGLPSLVLDDGTVLTQSMAILEWLDETYPTPPLLPPDPILRAKVRAAAQVIASEVHPVNNLRVLARLKAMGHDQTDTVAWMKHWMVEGFDAFAALISPTEAFSFGASPGLADLCLVPQLYNARRWGVDLAPYPRLVAIEARCLALSAFDAARPEAQADAT
ncbi:MAG: Maleylacetoacetate isomerase [Rhodobacteraceae bacterium]|uniref:maleylacetoacetate isomerase n=1 Tax=Cypionkella sp. TaxID=2811411 RepID=UPI00132C30E4|nr:maleylacetoacetate isomerase [Cypionkella sp.]KAF0172640.1 MAG: Maleylacetoacetate isomerase [Paracoccaceae bacterium]MDO8325970.1 maleylacetoacetate isomerase [Cypionkella sp.]